MEQNPAVMLTLIIILCAVALFASVYVASRPTPLHCAWCAAEKGIIPMPGVSHGVCNKHAKQMKEQLRTHNANTN